jgi:hypothetical protein
VHVGALRKADAALRGSIAASSSAPLGFHVQVVLRLHVHKPLRVNAEEAAEPQRDRGGDSLAAEANLVHAAARNMDRLGERVGAEAHRLEKFLAKHEVRMGQGNVAGYDCSLRQ